MDELREFADQLGIKSTGGRAELNNTIKNLKKRQLLSDIDSDKLIDGRPSKNSPSYKLDELRSFAKQLEIRSTGGKPELNAAIRNLKIEAGIE